jgi:hypothetical protein
MVVASLHVEKLLHNTGTNDVCNEFLRKKKKKKSKRNERWSLLLHQCPQHAPSSKRCRAEKWRDRLIPAKTRTSVLSFATNKNGEQRAIHRRAPNIDER